MSPNASWYLSFHFHFINKKTIQQKKEKKTSSLLMDMVKETRYQSTSNYLPSFLYIFINLLMYFSLIFLSHFSYVIIHIENET